jgi:hypothetical protein
VDRTRAEVEVLRAELGRTQEQATEGRIAAALLVELRAEAERLRAELAEARRPWWRRLIGS